MIKYFTIEFESGERLDRYLAGEMPDMSRSYIQKLIKDSQIYVNGKACKSKLQALF